MEPVGNNLALDHQGFVFSTCGLVIHFRYPKKILVLSAMAIHLFKNKWVNRTTVIYWFLLIYVLAALIWWFIALNLQNRQMTDLKLGQLDRKEAAYSDKACLLYTSPSPRD